MFIKPRTQPIGVCWANTCRWREPAPECRALPHPRRMTEEQSCQTWTLRVRSPQRTLNTTAVARSPAPGEIDTQCGWLASCYGAATTADTTSVAFKASFAVAAESGHAHAQAGSGK